MSDFAKLLFSGAVTTEGIDMMLLRHYRVEETTLGAIKDKPSTLPKNDENGDAIPSKTKVTRIIDQTGKTQGVFMELSNDYQLFTGSNPPDFKLFSDRLEIKQTGPKLSIDFDEGRTLYVSGQEKAERTSFDLSDYKGEGCSHLVIREGKARVQYSPRTSTSNVTISGEKTSVDAHMPSGMVKNAECCVLADGESAEITLKNNNTFDMKPSGPKDFSTRLHVEAPAGKKTLVRTLPLYRNGDGRMSGDFQQLLQDASDTVEKQAAEAQGKAR